MAPRINLPPVTRILLILLIALSFLYNLARWKQLSAVAAVTTGTSQTGSSPAPTKTPIIPYLTLVPASLLYNPWTLLIATLVEQNIFTLLVSGATIFYGGKYLERAWGSQEFGKFVVIVALITNFATAFLLIVLAGVMGKSSIALQPITGAIALQISFLIAFKQLVPEHTVTILRGLLSIRVKHFPALFLLLSFLSALLLGTVPSFLLTITGFFTSWTHLRFYKQQPDLTTSSTGGTLRGDASETFAFAYFFPDIIQPPIAALSDQIYSLLITLRLCTPFSDSDIESGNAQAVARGEAGLPNLMNSSSRQGGRGSKREEAERRRALALKALDQRLQSAMPGRAVGAGPSAPVPISVNAPRGKDGGALLGETTYVPDHEGDGSH